MSYQSPKPNKHESPLAWNTRRAEAAEKYIVELEAENAHYLTSAKQATERVSQLEQERSLNIENIRVALEDRDRLSCIAELERDQRELIEDNTWKTAKVLELEAGNARLREALGNLVSLHCANAEQPEIDWSVAWIKAGLVISKARQEVVPIPHDFASKVITGMRKEGFNDEQIKKAVENALTPTQSVQDPNTFCKPHQWLNGANDPDSKYQYCGKCGSQRWFTEPTAQGGSEK